MKSLHSALRDAWQQIQAYCKSNYAGVSTRDVQFRWDSGVYGWGEFGVTPEGIPYIVRGDHSMDSRSKNATWLYHPLYANAYAWDEDRCLEPVIRNWPTIKEKLEKHMAAERSIYNFRV